jgi:hypothetical protein
MYTWQWQWLNGSVPVCVNEWQWPAVAGWQCGVAKKNKQTLGYPLVLKWA